MIRLARAREPGQMVCVVGVLCAHRVCASLYSARDHLSERVCIGMPVAVAASARVAACVNVHICVIICDGSLWVGTWIAIYAGLRARACLYSLML